ncbi:MAG: hypothetical protein PGN07_06240 [Aeromicrobium erythreum]
MPNTGGKPPRKKHTVRNVLVLFTVLVVAGAVGIAYLVGRTADGVKNVVENSKASGPAKPVTVQEGAAFEIDGYRYAAGWKVSADELGDLQITDLEATNQGNVVSSPSISITFLSGGQEVASADCLGKSVDVDDTREVSCGSTDDLPTDYDSIRVEDLT